MKLIIYVVDSYKRIRATFRDMNDALAYGYLMGRELVETENSIVPSRYGSYRAVTLQLGRVLVPKE